MNVLIYAHTYNISPSRALVEVGMFMTGRARKSAPPPPHHGPGGQLSDTGPRALEPVAYFRFLSLYRRQ